MSFSISIQVNNSEKNALDKNITTITTLTGTLKEETSIVNPVILIECPLENIVRANYLTISIFNRSYFITNIKSIREGLVEITAHVDVLSSFKDSIRQNKAIIHRQQNQWNLYLNDGVLRTYQNPNIITKAFPSGFNTQEFVLAVASQ